ncbi:hypothetical protein MRB53_040626 [Persea americana]|nr:hypothetical protein MRB53_040626 [Persea americana]
MMRTKLLTLVMHLQDFHLLGLRSLVALHQACGLDRTGTLNGEEGKQSVRQPSMNPAQLVQMALELSESRRKHTLHAGTPAAANSILSQRQISGSQHTAQQSAIPPRTASLHSSQHGDSPNAKRLPNVDLNESNVLVDGVIPASYQYSPATLARAEKARRFFELADKHRRLLSYLHH